ncbi:uncharacterized protein TRIVIDRAFT_30389 [Trichoderma virens Gv29-8]|uniref:Mitotic apparatus protein p62 n=1 Tax=Hypocrea virens (strain Gv29-8 / FGSC 10586) TaxID=413071 RepID=G9MM89_HYPVG|nr:uncharacterized protein TRIVIDRAFT_30389 [Trichoderma virens Gv29-8]EHK24458.1 hypothetical protein TRIVIDRAFT_30389 [Trichoderma virens Gv29-8]UKZ54730.1 hypothetical protein TrVGV298_008542 [Trichoderma virens]
MAASRVIKLPRDDDESTYALIQVIQNGSKPLDVKLVGTEGEAPYVTSLKHDRVASLQVPNCPVSESEWQAILQSLFALQPTADIQATVGIESETSLSITVRKRVQGITQRLGSIELKHDENEGIELFKWCAEATDALTQSNVALAEAAAHAKELETTVKELKTQLDELITSKQDDETALLLKFRDLLNEKKVKIREQRKVLAAGPFQSSQPASQGLQPLDSKPSRSPAPSRPRKRKVQAVEAPSKEPEDDEMEVDKIKIEPQDSEQEDTAEDTASGGSDDDGNDDDDDDGDTHDDNSGSGVDSSAGPAPRAPPPPPKKAVEQPPAPRSLPFAKKAAPAKAPAAEGETDSDDEL